MAQHPAEEIELVLKASGLHDYLETNRAFALLAADSLRECAHVLKTGIKEYLRSKGDVMVAGSKANRVAKPLLRAAGYHEVAAKQFGLAWSYYNGIMIPQEVKADRGRVFDPTA